MSPAVALVVTVFERGAVLIEKGTPPAKALRQVAQELEAYAEAHGSEMVPHRPFPEALGITQKRAA